MKSTQNGIGSPPCDDRTRLATGINASHKYKEGFRQIMTTMDEELFNIVKAEAIRSNISMSSLVRQCIELVLK